MRRNGGHRWWPAALGVGVLLTGACTASGSDDAADPESVRLVAFDSCQEAQQRLQDALPQSPQSPPSAQSPQSPQSATEADTGAGADRMRAQAPPAGEATVAAAGSTVSGAGLHEPGVGHPDLISSEGDRIVTVTGGELRVVDAQQREETGALDLTADAPDGTDGEGGDAARAWWRPAEVLVHDDRALVLQHPAWWGGAPGPVPDGPDTPDGEAAPAPMPEPAPADEGAAPDSGAGDAGQAGAGQVGAGQGDAPEPLPVPAERRAAGPRLLLIDLDGPSLLGEFTVEGTLVDARADDATARVVVRAAPHRGPTPSAQDTAGGVLPRHAGAAGDDAGGDQVPCGEVYAPAEFSGESLLTVLTFDLTAPELGDGDPVSVVADGQAIHSSGDRLYVAHTPPVSVTADEPSAGTVTAEVRTEIHAFDTSGTDTPRYVGGGALDGRLTGRQALSAWQGDLRVAATTPGGSQVVAVFAEDGEALAETGRVTVAQPDRGSGSTGDAGDTGIAGDTGDATDTEPADVATPALPRPVPAAPTVAFAGDTGYLATGGPSATLHTLDLADPAAPEVAGATAVPEGHLARLYPLEEGRLAGLHSTTSQPGEPPQTHLVAYDVSDPAAPAVTHEQSLGAGRSLASSDLQALGWTPEQRLLTVPLTDHARDDGEPPEYVLEVQRLADGEFHSAARLRHPDPADEAAAAPEIRRAVAAAGALWTLSPAGLAAHDLATFDEVAWLPAH